MRYYLKQSIAYLFFSAIGSLEGTYSNYGGAVSAALDYWGLSYLVIFYVSCF